MADSEAKHAATRILTATDVKQIAVIEAFKLLVVLVRGNLEVYALSTICSSPPTAEKLQTLQSNCSMFIEGCWMGKYLICGLESSMFSSTVRIFEVKGSPVQAADSQTPAKSAVDLHVFKEFYLPYKSSAMMLAGSGVCMASKNGLYLVSLDTLGVKPFRH